MVAGNSSQFMDDVKMYSCSSQQPLLFPCASVDNYATMPSTLSREQSEALHNLCHLSHWIIEQHTAQMRSWIEFPSLSETAQKKRGQM